MVGMLVHRIVIVYLAGVALLAIVGFCSLVVERDKWQEQYWSIKNEFDTQRQDDSQRWIKACYYYGDDICTRVNSLPNVTDEMLLEMYKY